MFDFLKSAFELFTQPENIDFAMNLLGSFAIFTVFILFALLVIKADRIKVLQASLNRYKKSFEELDEQAKIIVKTDLALNKTQEELDKKLSGLYTLQKLTRAMSTTLEEEKIFASIQEYLIQELGFDQCLIFVVSEAKTFLLKVRLGCDIDKAETIQDQLSKNATILAIINQGRAISSIGEYGDKEVQTIFALKEAIGVRDFVLAPILRKGQAFGLLFMGNNNPTITLTEGDEELVSIVAWQLGQALDNAGLFEQAWKAQHELEEKIKTRTKELENVLAEVRAASRRKTEFVSAVSHELRTPLTSIKGYAALLIEGKLGDIPAAVKERLEKINRHSDELTHMVNDLLDISRIESGKVAMKLEPIDIKELIDAISDMFSPVLNEKKINLSVDLPAGQNKILADATQIKRVFINLIGNALKFTPADGKITVRATDAQENLKIDISDTGIGIAQEDVFKIFDEFFRVDNTINQTVKGTGLGLSLVRSIVEAHGSKVEVKSALGKGTTFSFVLRKA